MAKRINILVSVLLLASVVCIVFVSNRMRKAEGSYQREVANNKSLLQRIDGAEADIIAYTEDISVLRATKDSLFKELIETKDRLGIKDKQVQSLMNSKTEYYVHDTLRLIDTVFRDPSFSLDTILYDKWRINTISLRYPSSIDITTAVYSDRDVIVYTNRETIDPPKKFFLCRWFQKKHTVTRVVVEEKCPYILSQQNVYVKTTD